MSANHFNYTGFFKTSEDGLNAKKTLENLSLEEQLKKLGLAYLIDSALNLEEITVSDTRLNISFETGTSGETDIDLLKKLKPLNIEFVKVNIFFDQVGETETEFFYRGQHASGETLNKLLKEFDPSHNFFQLLEDYEFGQACRLMGEGDELCHFANEKKVLHRLVDLEQLNLFSYILDEGADPNVIDDECILQYILERQDSDDTPFIKCLLKHNANTDFEPSDGGSFLWCLFENHAPVATTLTSSLPLIAPEDAYEDEDVWQQLSVAIIHHDNTKALQLLLDAPNDEPENFSTLLSDAVSVDNIKIFKHLIALFPEVLQTDKSALFETSIYAKSTLCCNELWSLVADEIDFEEELETITDTLSANLDATTLLDSWLTKVNEDLGEITIENYDAVSKAVKYQCDENLKLLLSGKINFDVEETPLHELVHDLTPTALEIMINAGFKLDQENDEGQTFAEFAIEKLDARNPLMTMIMASFNDKPIEQKIWAMLQTDNIHEFKTLFSDLPDKNLVNDQGNNLLMQAISLNSKLCFDFLCSQSPEISHKNTLGNNAIALAVIAGNLDNVSSLLELGADANSNVCFAEEEEESEEDDEGADAMMSLLGLEGMNELEKIREAIEEKLVIMGDDSTCLMLAATNGHLQICEALLAHNAPVNETDEEGENALYYAVRNGHLNVFNLLIEKGIEVKNDRAGDSLLITAAYHQHSQLIKPLIAAGNNINQKAKDGGETALCTSAAFGVLYDNEQLSMLIELGADINIKADNGNSPLIYSCENLNSAGVESLLKAGADTNAINDEGKTAYDLYLEAQDQFESIEPDKLKPTSSMIGLKKTIVKIKRFIFGSIVPVAITWLIISFFSEQFAKYFLYLVAAWWAFKLIRSVKKRFKTEEKTTDAPLAKAGSVLLNVMAEAAEKEERKKEKMKDWEND